MNIVFLLAGLIFIIGGIALAIYTKKVLPIIVSFVGIISFVFAFSFTFVPSGYVGVRTAYGQISDKPTKNGFNWKVPFVEKINNVNCKQQEVVYSGQVWSETNERTELYCENIAIDYQIDPEYAAWIWTNIEEWDTNLIKSTTIESGIKAATKKFNDTDVTDRSKIENAAKECIQESLNIKYKNQILNITSVTIGNINFSDAYNEAIEKKAQAKLAAETAEYTNKQATIQVEAEAEQTRIKAEADAEANRIKIESKAEQIRIKAEGEAEAIRVKAQAQAEANKLIAESLTPELNEYEKISKWDGKLSVVSGSGAVITDIGNIIEDEGETNNED